MRAPHGLNRGRGGPLRGAPQTVSHQVFCGLGGTQLGPAQVRSAQKLGDGPFHLEVHLDAVLAHLWLPHLQENAQPGKVSADGSGGRCPPSHARGTEQPGRRLRAQQPLPEACALLSQSPSTSSISPETGVLRLGPGNPGIMTFRACSAHRTNRSGLKLSVGSNSDLPRLADLINS